MSINEHIQDRFGLDTKIGETVSENTTLSDILTRRSCRAYKPDPVPEDLIETLYATAFSAPSKSDLQQACVVQINDRDKQQRIAALSPHTAWAENAPLFMIWCGDSRRIRRVCELRHHAFANDHLDAFMNAAVDAGIAMQTFTAESVGLGCCPVSEIRDQIKAFSIELNLPKWVFPITGLCVGWPVDQSRLSLRLPLDVTVHTDSYDDSELFQQIVDYDSRRENFEQTPPEQQRMTEKFGFSSEYGWSENRSRQYAMPARSDFGRYIRAQGFGLS